ncbi:DUF3800 domain-containing protein [Chloroflexota bacterium]
MSSVYSIYCDESCHLEKDHIPVMVMGALWCPLEKIHEIFKRLKEIKIRHGLAPSYEIKWTKVSPSKIAFFINVLDYFFDDDDLHFRVLIVPDKEKLRHDIYGQTHDEFYYKMFFDLLKVIFNPEDCYRLYFDIKDTNSGSRIAKLHDVLSNSMYGFDQNIIENVQTVRSHEVELIQLVDLLTGIISYNNRGLSTSEAKLSLVKRMQDRSGYSLTKTTLLRESKVNIFIWHSVEDQ